MTLRYLLCSAYTFITIGSPQVFAQDNGPFLSGPPPVTKPAAPHHPKVAKPIPSVPREPPASSAKSPAPAPLAAPAAQSAGPVRPSENKELALPGYEFFQRGYSASQMQNYAEAKGLYQLGAEKGDANCMYSLGNLYAEGLGVKPDYGLAQTWYQQSADHGNPTGLYGIGLLYLGGGPGIPRDCAAARRWFELAAARGSSLAHDWLDKNHTCP